MADRSGAEPAANAANLPQDAILVQQILESMDVKEYEPRVLQQLMDFMYRYTAEIMQDAEAISERAGAPRGELSLQDVMLAVQSRAQHSFVQPPSQQLLARIAAQHNRRPLPELRQDRHGLRLPPDVECLMAPNYQLQPRTPPGVSAPAPAAPQQAQHTAAAGPPPGVRRDHRIAIRAPATLPEAEAQGAGGVEAPAPPLQQYAQQGQHAALVQQGAGRQQQAQQALDDIDIDFEDI